MTPVQGTGTTETSGPSGGSGRGVRWTPESGAPAWFGPPERPLFGMVHVPADGAARGGAVLCSPLGREDLAVHSAYRALAGRLAGEGLAVVRFDYDGTGNSSGSASDPDRVAAWGASIGSAVSLLRSTGVRRVALVGMRMGATLAALEAPSNDVDALVLWDPCISGRAFLRELRALHTMSVGEPPTTDGSVQTPGFRFDAPTVAAMGALDVTKGEGPLAPRLLVLCRPDRPVEGAFEARLRDAGSVDLELALGQNGRASCRERVLCVV